MPFRVSVAPGSKEQLSTSTSGRYVYLKSGERTEHHTVKTKISRRTISHDTTSRASSTETVDTVTGRVIRKTDFHDMRCIAQSGSFAVELTHVNGLQSAALRSAENDSRIEFPQMVNFMAGCSISSDGKYVVVASGKPPQKTAALRREDNDDLFGGRLGGLKTDLEVYDIGGLRTVAVLQDEQGKPAKLLFPCEFRALDA